MRSFLLSPGSALRAMLVCAVIAMCASLTACSATPVDPIPSIERPTPAGATASPSPAPTQRSTVPPTGAPLRTPPPIGRTVRHIPLQGFPAGVNSLAWSPDGGTLATSAGELGSRAAGTERIWLWGADGKPGPVLSGHTDRVTDLAWAPDGSVLASGSLDGTVRLWRPDGTPGATLATQAGGVFSVAWSPDGARLAVGALRSATDNTAQIWRRDGTLQSTLHTSFSGGKFYNVAWSPNGRYLAAGATDYGVWDADGNLLGRTVAGAGSTPAWALAWAPDSSRWATGNESGSIRILDTAATEVANLFAGSSIDALAWSPDGSVLVGGSETWATDGTPRGGLGQSSEQLGAPVSSLAWSPDGSIVAAGTRTGQLGLFNRAGDRLLLLPTDGTPTDQKRVNALAWSPDGTILAAGYGDSIARLWQVGEALLP
jgi:WD40 repeat protein